MGQIFVASSEYYLNFINTHPKIQIIFDHWKMKDFVDITWKGLNIWKKLPIALKIKR